MNQNKSTANPNPEAILPGEAVYALSPGKDLIEHGRVLGEPKPNTWFNTAGRVRPVHRTQLFRPIEVAETAIDLMEPSPEGQTVHVSEAIRKVIDNPIDEQELSARLGSAALERYLNDTRTPEEIGLIDKEALLGDVNTPGTNIWTVEELRRGIERGAYKQGTFNNLIIASLKKDIEVVPSKQAQDLKAQIDEVNREMLEDLYARYDIDYGKAQVFERIREGVIERRTIYPSASTDMCFVESSMSADNPDPMQSVLQGVKVFVGTPENPDYLPAI